MKTFEIKRVRPHKEIKRADSAFRAYQKEKRKEYAERRKKELELKRKPFVDLVLGFDDYQREFLCRIFKCKKQDLINELINLDELLKSFPNPNEK